MTELTKLEFLGVLKDSIKIEEKFTVITINGVSICYNNVDLIDDVIYFRRGIYTCAMVYIAENPSIKIGYKRYHIK